MLYKILILKVKQKKLGGEHKMIVLKIRNENYSKEKGITLIALVITIIVLLILARSNV